MGFLHYEDRVCPLHQLWRQRIVGIVIGAIQYSRLDWVSILRSIPLFSVKESEILVLFQNRGHSPSYSDVSFPWASWSAFHKERTLGE